MSDDEADLRTANRAKVFVALDYLADGLNTFVQQQLQRYCGDAWLENVSRINGHAADLTDPYILLATIDDKWHMFNICFKNVPHPVIKELRIVRNATSHSGSFSDKEVDNSMSSILRLLNSMPPSAKIIKIAGKMKKLREQPFYGTNETSTSAENKDAVILDTEQQNASEAQSGIVPDETAAIRDDDLEDKQTSVEDAQHLEASSDVAPAHDAPAVTYNFSRLCFKASQIEPLQDDQAFRVVTPVGSFQMTKAEFRKSFPKVILSKSYSENGIYHYPAVPKSALPYKLPE